MRSKHIFRLRGSRERLETKEELEQLKKEGSRRARKKMETIIKMVGLVLGTMTVNESFSLRQETRKS